MKKLFLLFIILIIPILLYSQNKDNMILVLPFVNQGEIQNDYEGEVIQSTLFVFFTKLAEYSSILPSDLKNYMDNNNYSIGDLQNIETLTAIAQSFNARHIVRGSYYEKENQLMVSFEVIKSDSEKIIYRAKDFGPGGIDSLDTINAISETMVQDFTGIILELGRLKINSDNQCDLYIDNEIIGVTPFNKRLPTGQHTVTIYYHDDGIKKQVFNQMINLTKDKVLELEIKVFVTVTIESEDVCQVLIDDKPAGITPLSIKLLSGNNYNIAIYLEREKSKELIDCIIIDTSEMVDLQHFFAVNGKIDIIDSRDLFTVELKNKKEQLVLQGNTIYKGKWKIKGNIVDPAWNRKFTFYNKVHTITPQSAVTLDLDKIQYKPLWGLCFIPAVSQFYNRNITKGAIVTSLIAGASALTAMAYFFGWINYQYVYIPAYNNNQPIQELDRLLNNSNIIQWACFSVGLVVLFCTWVYSLIDGLVTMNHINRIFNPDKKKIRVSFMF